MSRRRWLQGLGGAVGLVVGVLNGHPELADVGLALLCLAVPDVDELRVRQVAARLLRWLDPDRTEPPEAQELRKLLNGATTRAQGEKPPRSR